MPYKDYSRKDLPPLAHLAIALSDLGVDTYVAGYLAQVMEEVEGNGDACVPLLLTIGALARARDCTAKVVESNGQERGVYTLVPKNGGVPRIYMCVDMQTYEWILAWGASVSVDPPPKMRT